MIPKIIHYCWFGPKNLSPLNEACIQSWLKYYPDYKIILWNEENSPLEHPFLKMALAEKKYAFASDFTRFYALYNYGGVYLDTDMECIKALNIDMLYSDFFAAYEDLENKYVSCGMIGAKQNSEICLRMLECYDNSKSYENVPLILTKVIKNTQENFTIYPSYYFYPYNPYDSNQKVKQFMYCQVKEDTYAIHHWEKTWNLSFLDKLKKRFLILIAGIK